MAGDICPGVGRLARLAYGMPMVAVITIEAERRGDEATIASIVRRAYENVSYSDHREHIMIDRLRQTDAFDASLSLLATVDGEPAGHILLTKASILSPQSSVATLALAPLSVVPEHQQSGVGKRLVLAAHEQAGALGYGSIVLVGLPDYYPLFGYQPLNRYPISLPFEAPAENCMILPLSPNALTGVSGVVTYAPVWFDH